MGAEPVIKKPKDLRKGDIIRIRVPFEEIHPIIITDTIQKKYEAENGTKTSLVTHQNPDSVL